jgi:hypothetical protein
MQDALAYRGAELAQGQAVEREFQHHMHQAQGKQAR